MPGILVTGFAPFKSRTVNASWMTASAIARTGLADALEIPVVWGAPSKILNEYCQNQCPDTIVGLGEGNVQGFKIETVARNTRGKKLDNSNQYPGVQLIEHSGPETYTTEFDVDLLHRNLLRGNFPVQVSSDAGQFLCEETLYTLESLRHIHEQLQHVVFIHVPPFGTTLTGTGQRSSDTGFYEAFGQYLINTVKEMLHSPAA